MDEIIQHTIESLDGYGEKDWDKFSKAMLEEFRDDDIKVTLKELRELCNEHHEDVVSYTREFERLSTNLSDVRLSATEERQMYLEGLPEKVQDRVLDKLSAERIRDLPEIKSLKSTAMSVHRRSKFASEIKSKIRDNKTMSKPLEPIGGGGIDKSVEKLEEMFRDLKIYITSASSQVSGGSRQTVTVNQCHWCDKEGHRRDDCHDLLDALKDGKIMKENGIGKLVWKDDKHFVQLRSGRGGMRSTYEQFKDSHHTIGVTDGRTLQAEMGAAPRALVHLITFDPSTTEGTFVQESLS